MASFTELTAEDSREIVAVGIVGRTIYKSAERGQPALGYYYYPQVTGDGRALTHLESKY